jgi:hypothetical protein
LGVPVMPRFFKFCEIKYLFLVTLFTLILCLGFPKLIYFKGFFDRASRTSFEKRWSSRSWKQLH